MEEIITEKGERETLGYQILNYLKEKKGINYRGGFITEGWFTNKEIDVICKFFDPFTRIDIVRHPKWWDMDNYYGALMGKGHLTIDCGKKEMTLTTKIYHQLAVDIGEKFGMEKLNKEGAT